MLVDDDDFDVVSLSVDHVVVSVIDEMSIRVLKDVKFTKRQITQLKKTPFWSFVEAISKKKVQEHNMRKNDDDVVQIIRKYSRARNQFRLGRKWNTVGLTNKDISLIIRIQLRQTRINLSGRAIKPDSKFVHRRFPAQLRMTASDLKIQFNKAVKGKTKQDDSDLARLLTIYLCATLCFHNNWSNVKLGIHTICGKCPDIMKFAWSEVIKHFVILSLERKC
ncbi:hypothetical protein U1Q18_030587 [Sarracenia purpurea var. burkii]